MDSFEQPEVRAFGHPGKGKGRARRHDKGRQVDPAALGEVRDLLGDGPRRRDLLIEYLHLIQDRHRCLRHRHLAALADDMGLAMAEVYEVATFYAHFDVRPDDAPAPAEIMVRVCDSLSCQLKGAGDLLARLGAEADATFEVRRAPCMGRCDRAPVAEVGHHHVERATAEAVGAAISDRRLAPEPPASRSLEAYRAEGGYRVLTACRDGKYSVDAVLGLVKAAGLRGLGGAGFPAASKWRFVLAEPGPRMLAINADEGEPGTFKDRHYLELDPHRFLEGTLIAAWAIEATAVYIYLRDEYPGTRDLLTAEIARLEDAAVVAPGYIHLRRGAGAYICGEESAMLESLEGKRGLPRHKPPFPAQVGLFGRPTLIHNVETVYWLRDIIEKGDGGAGQVMRSYSVSGRVRNPGVKLAPAGTTARQLIDDYCGGMEDGHEFKAYLPGGASGGILPAVLGDLPLDFGTLEEYGCFIGSAAVVILSDRDDMGAVALNLLRFFEDESCGQCTPCRLGTEKAVKLMAAGNWDEGLLRELVTVMGDASICGLGQAAGNPIASVLTHFGSEVTGRRDGDHG